MLDQSNNRLEWPRISIVTPSLNQGQYIEETLLSVLNQGYPNLEYIVIDAGSTDQSVEIIRKYQDRLTYWVSEPDRGQAHAINKGFEKANGSIYGYLNSDDLLRPKALFEVARNFISAESPADYWAVYPVIDFGIGGEVFRKQSSGLNLAMWVARQASLHQPGVFWTSSLFQDVGGFDESLYLAFDRKLFMEFVARGIQPHVYDGPAAAKFRVHTSSKTFIQGSPQAGKRNFIQEFLKLSEEFFPRLDAEEQKWVVDQLLQAQMSRLLKELEFSEVSNLKATARFLQLGLRRPRAFRTRFYWGTLRRFLSGANA